MSDMSGGTGCSVRCWLTAAAICVVTALLALAGHYTLGAAVVLGVIACVLLGLLFTWLFCAGVPKLGVSAMPAPAPVAPVTQPAPVATAPVAPAAAPAPAAAKPVTEVKAPEPAPVAVVSEEPAPVDDAPGDGDAAADRDGDGVAEGSDEGRKPAGLAAARDGGPDDLKRIKGIGPKLEQLCHELGFYHFDQIADWTADEVAWVDANLKGFKGRVTRDNWVEQAKLLATGGETEFSKRVDKGDVY
ncbi:endonuclease [Mesobacterium sp. TK19101]|uniref:Endonuclease n=1 Tax=Mesobacterium hydrothermale TaxID=3111907 RepID=A0ABU6HDU1_9RHOB|nr:endonuclease [Mesobacterium sp. TK19101]MEC3860035.1 endonuclease [Mesobacterium sp. TK19101]